MVVSALSIAAVTVQPKRLPSIALIIALAYFVGAISRRRDHREAEISPASPAVAEAKREAPRQVADIKSRLDLAAKAKMESLVKRNHELLALYSLANVVGASLELSEVLSVALDGVIKIFGAQAGEVNIAGVPEETLVRFCRGETVLAEHKGSSAPRLNRELAARAAKTALPVLTGRGSTDCLDAPAEAPAKGIGQMAAFPIRTKSRTLGVITLGLPPDRCLAAKADQELLLSVGSMIGTAIENSQLYQHLKRVSDTDPITGLYNHRFILKRLNAEIRRAGRYGHSLSVLMLDIDKFKVLNDTFGHPFGDNALKKIATATVAACRETDFVGRYGGDEFLVVLPETQAEAAATVSDRVRGYIQNLSLVPQEGRSKEAIAVTASLGLAVYPGAGSTGTDLIIAADKNLYVSKRAGGNRVAQS